MTVWSAIGGTLPVCASRPRHREFLESNLTSARSMAVTAAYAYTAIRIRTTWRALPFFAVSYVLLGLALDYGWMVVWKGFAPSEPTVGDYVGSVTWIVVVLVAVVLLAFNHYRAARARSSATM